MNNDKTDEQEQKDLAGQKSQTNKLDVTPSESGSGDPGRTPGKAEGVEDPEIEGNQ